MSENQAVRPAAETQLADFLMPPASPEARVIVGRTYAFSFSDVEVNIAFPQGINGLEETQQAARLEGRFELFIEDVPKEKSEARIWIADVKENIHGLNVFGIEVFTLETSMLDYTGFDFDNPMGSLNVETGEYKLTYAINPRHAVLSELGLGEDVGTIVVHEQGTIKLEAGGGASFRTRGSLTIEQGFFAGTGIIYPSKGGTADPVTEVTLWLSLSSTGCGTYAGSCANPRLITGSGVFAIVRYGDAGTAINFRGVTRTYSSTRWDTSWNGQPANGVWSMALINRGIPCGEFPSSVTLNVKVPV